MKNKSKKIYNCIYDMLKIIYIKAPLNNKGNLSLIRFYNYSQR